MKTWIWPLSWYFRIRHLELEVAVLKAHNRKLDEDLRSAYMQQTMLTTTYVSSLSSIASMQEEERAQRKTTRS